MTSGNLIKRRLDNIAQLFHSLDTVHRRNAIWIMKQKSFLSVGLANGLPTVR
jgi:HK97 family phage major capsid protein